MRITLTYGAYNDRRYGRPWIAKVTAWPVGGKPTLEWGGYVGSAAAGGECEIEAAEGDLLKSGQKDYRGGRTGNEFYVVRGGKAEPVTDTEARNIWIAASKAKAAGLVMSPEDDVAAKAKAYDIAKPYIKKLDAALREIAEGNLDNETQEQFAERCVRVAKEGLRL